MLKRFSLYPFLWILFVIFNPLINNLDQANPAQAFRPLVVFLLVAIFTLLLMRTITKDWHYAGYLTFLILFWFFIYGHLHNLISEILPEEHVKASPSILLGVLTLIVIILGLRKTWSRLGGSRRVTPFLNLVLILAVISQAPFGVMEFVKSSPNTTWQSAVVSQPQEATSSRTLDCSISPDIYWIVLDGYGRADVLEELYGVDNHSFLASLEGKGFYIADRSHSNYIQTVYSIPSVLNLNFLKPMPANVSGYDYFPALIANNQMMDLLRPCDYRMVSFETGFFFTTNPDSDIYFSFGSALTEFEELLLAGTPLDYLVDKLNLETPKHSYAAHRGRVQFTFEKLAQLPESPGPKFVFAHIISPHPPFVFDAEGNPTRPNRSYSIGDGNDYRGSWEEYRGGYAEQVQYVNTLVEKTITAIISRSATPPVIIIQGDHGPGGFLNWGTPGQSCLWERASILNAYYLPNGGTELLYPDITPVNSMRVVLNAYFGANLELLPSATYFTSHVLGGEFIDITDRRDSRANCN